MDNIIDTIASARYDALWWLDGRGPIGQTLASDVWDVAMAALQAREFALYISAREGWPCSTWYAYRALLNVRPWRTMDHGTIAPWRFVSTMAAAYRDGTVPVD